MTIYHSTNIAVDGDTRPSIHLNPGATHGNPFPVLELGSWRTTLAFYGEGPHDHAGAVDQLLDWLGSALDQAAGLDGSTPEGRRRLADTLAAVTDRLVAVGVPVADDHCRPCCATGWGDPHGADCDEEPDHDPTGELAATDGSREMAAAAGIAAARQALTDARKAHPFNLDHIAAGDCDACALKWDRAARDAEEDAIADLDDQRMGEVA